MKAFLLAIKAWFLLVVFNIPQNIVIVSFNLNQYQHVRQRYILTQMCTSSSSNTGKGFQKNSIPKPNIIVPSQGSQNPHLEKFLMM